MIIAVIGVILFTLLAVAGLASEYAKKHGL